MTQNLQEAEAAPSEHQQPDPRPGLAQGGPCTLLCTKAEHQAEPLPASS